jgi:hypothetical protein
MSVQMTVSYVKGLPCMVFCRVVPCKKEARAADADGAPVGTERVAMWAAATNTMKATYKHRP